MFSHLKIIIQPTYQCYSRGNLGIIAKQKELKKLSYLLSSNSFFMNRAANILLIGIANNTTTNNTGNSKMSISRIDGSLGLRISIKTYAEAHPPTNNPSKPINIQKARVSAKESLTYTS